MISDKEGNRNRNRNRRKDGSDDSESEDTYSTVTMMPTSTICPSMVRGSSINSCDTSTPESINHPFVDDDDASATMHPSASATSCQSLNSYNYNSYNSDALEMEPFLLTSEPTRAGRRRKCRDMSSLSLCLCGVNMQPDTAGSIRCQRAGCETIWVSDPFPLFIEYN